MVRELERTATYTPEAKVANQWTQDGVVIAGDAAHLMPPLQAFVQGSDVENLMGGSALAERTYVSLSYQTEREPHVRATIDLAVMMGKVVCVTDPEAALARDKNLIETRRANGDASGAIPNPKLVTGLLQEHSQIAGELFPQFTHQKKRSDDVFGPGAWLIGESDGVDRNTLRAAGIGVPSLSSFSSWYLDVDNTVIGQSWFVPTELFSVEEMLLSWLPHVEGLAKRRLR